MEKSGRYSGMSLLIVDDESLVCELLTDDLAPLKNEGLSIYSATSVKRALDIVANENIHVVVLDKQLSEIVSKDPEQNGIEAIPLFTSYNSRLRILIHTSSEDISDVVRAMKLGATNYLPKNGKKGTSELVVEQVRSALEQARIIEKNMRLSCGDKSAKVSQISVESKNPLMRGLMEKLKRFATTDEPVVLLGESGVGKTTLAGYVHKLRFENKDAPFIQQSLNALSQNVFESELFGSAKGAFTDAIDKIGYLEAANGGTLFIDEIGELSLESQAKLLTALESGVFYRVGESTRKRTSKFRLITATNKNPEELVKQGKMREDFYARICSFQVELPSIKDRPEDIPAIIASLLPVVSEKNHYKVTYDMLPESFVEWVVENPPRLNIRGVRMILSHLVALTPLDRYGVKDFSTWKATLSDIKVQTTRTKQNSGKITWKDVVDSKSLLTPDFPGWKSFTRDLELKLILENADNVRDLSRLIKVSEATIYRRLQEHGGAES